MGSCLPPGLEYFIPRLASTLLDAEYFISGPLALPAPFVAALIYIDFICSMAVPIGELEAFISGPPPPPSQPHALRAPSVSAPLYINPNGSMAGPGGCAIPTMITIGQ